MLVFVVCLEFQIMWSVISTFTPIFFIEISFVLPPPPHQVSKAATSLCLWVRAKEKYYHVARAVAPKRERLREAQASLEDTLAVGGRIYDIATFYTI